MRWGTVRCGAVPRLGVRGVTAPGRWKDPDLRLVLKRLRGTGDAGKSVSQVMYDTFQDDVEYRAGQAHHALPRKPHVQLTMPT